MKEVDLQRIVCGSLNEQGGFGHKYPAADGYVGWPDLILIHPEFFTFQLEIKVLKDLKEGWKRKINTTDKQVATMEKIIKYGGRAAVGVISYYSPTEQYLTILPPSTEQLKEEDMKDHLTTVRREPRTGFDVVRAVRLYKLNFR